MQIVGTTAGLRFEISPSNQEEEFPGLAWLKIGVWLGETQIWSQSDDLGQIGESKNPVDWTWVDFLSGLARSWPWLMLENSYPIPIDPLHPGELQKVSRARWDSLPTTVAEEEEDALFDFKMCHDVAQFMRGIFLSPLWILLAGKEYLLWSPEIGIPIYRPAKEVRQTLEEFGNFLSDYLKGSQESRAAKARESWNARFDAIKREYLQVSSGLSKIELGEISVGYSTPEIFFELDTAVNDIDYWLDGNELLAAARMTSTYFSLKTKRILIEYIRQISRCSTPELDQLSHVCPNVDHYGSIGYEQGYGLATWLRSRLNISSDRFFDCETTLLNWGVQLRDVTLSEVPGLDALAVWGPQRGPTIFLNMTFGARPSTQNGRRTTIAHEICHLLCDRLGALPLVEVLGGQVPKHSEQRARAFAAELLLPRFIAEKTVQHTQNILDAANHLAETFKVSREVVRRQITNSSAKENLSLEGIAQLEKWVGTSQ